MMQISCEEELSEFYIIPIDATYYSDRGIIVPLRQEIFIDRFAHIDHVECVVLMSKVKE